MFKVPESDDSGLPSTPIAPRRSQAAHPSTTPLGPPPFQSSAREPPSFTPAGQPPSVPFGSSQYGRTGMAGISSYNVGARGSTVARPTASRSLFATTLDSSERGKPSAFTTGARGRTFEVPPSSPPGVVNISDDEEEDDEDTEEDEMEYVQDRANDTMTMDIAQDRGRIMNKPQNNIRTVPPVDAPEDYPDVRAIARGVIAAQPAPKLTEPDALILRTEEILERELYSVAEGDDPMAANSSERATKAAQKLRTLWARYGKLDAGERQEEAIGPKKDQSPTAKGNFLASLILQLYQPSSDELPGPAPGSDFGRVSTNALILASADRPTHMPKIIFDWLDSYHDPGASILDEVRPYQNQGLAASNSFWDALYTCAFRGRFKMVLDLLSEANFAVTGPRPEAGPPNYGYGARQLEHINQAVDHAVRVIQSCPAVSDNNWDIPGSEWRVFRMRVEQAIKGLREMSEPENQFEDDLDEFGPGRKSQFGQGSMFGGRSQFGLSESTRRAESLIPFEIFEGLLNLYNIFLGKQEDLLQSAFSWLEATLCLAAWWDGEESSLSAPQMRSSFGASRRSVMRSQQTRTVDLTPALAYQQRLAQTFEIALIEGGGQEEGSMDSGVDESFDSTSPLHIGLASMVIGDVAAALDILRGFSLTMAAAITEVANEAGWLPDARPSSRAGAGALGLIPGFNDSDLMVLNYGQEDAAAQQQSRRDKVLVKYSDLLAVKGDLEDQVAGEKSTGFAVALKVLARVDDYDLVEVKVAKILNERDLASAEEVDGLLNLCLSLDFAPQAVQLADRYASNLLNHSLANPTKPAWGQTLFYYARAKQPQKLKDIVNMLVSMSLLHSAAYPPTAHLDDRLKALLENPQEALEVLAAVDPGAATLIATDLAGYANLRRFYDLRDVGEGKQAQTNGTAQHSEGDAIDVSMADEGSNIDGSLAIVKPAVKRSKESADCLLTAIASAGDCIRGGLYDPSVATVMSVEGLLVLLGEALVFVNRTPRNLDLPSLHALLRAIEDISTIGAKIYNTADTFLQSAIANYHDTAAAAAGTKTTRSKTATLSKAQSSTPEQITPRSLLLQKSNSTLTSSSGAFSMISSGMLNSTTFSDLSDGSGVLIKDISKDTGSSVESGFSEVERGWDWRKGIRRDATGKDILGILRYGIAHEVAKAWAMGEGVN